MPDMIGGSNVARRVGEPLVVLVEVVAVVVDARETADSEAVDVDHGGGAEIVHIWGYPATMVAVEFVSIGAL